MAEHWDHDVHGPMVLMHKDGSIEIDEDCDCPEDCEGCRAEGIIE